MGKALPFHVPAPPPPPEFIEPDLPEEEPAPDVVPDEPADAAQLSANVHFDDPALQWTPPFTPESDAEDQG